MKDKIKNFAKNHAEEIVLGSIILAINITIATTGITIGYKMAEHDLEIVGMTSYHDTDTDKITGVVFRQRNGETVSYKAPVRIN